MSAIDPLALRDAIVAGLAAAMPARVTVEAHDGTFDEAELKRCMTRAPAVFVAIPGVERMRKASSGQLELPIRFVAVILAKDKVSPRQGRGDVAVSLAALVSSVVDANRWGLDGVAGPEDLEARNEFTSKIDAAGVALWQVMWCQALRMGADRGEIIAALQTLVVNGIAFSGSGAEPGTDPMQEGVVP